MRNGQYLRHDVSASSSPKLMKLLQEEGPRGYGVYWVVLETLRMQRDFRLPLSMLGLVAHKARTHQMVVRRVVLDFDLFAIENDYFSSPGMNRRMQQFVDKVGTMSKETCQVFDSNVPIISYLPDDSARVEEKRKEEETNNSKKETVVAASQDRVEEGAATPSLPVLHAWEGWVDRMSADHSWMEIVGMHSGLGLLYRDHQPWVVALFKEHIRLYDKGRELLSDKEVKPYFANYLAPGSRTCTGVREKLLAQLAQQQQAVQVSPYETMVDGRRTYLGRLIPDDAPPRPDAYAVWDEETKEWRR